MAAGTLFLPVFEVVIRFTLDYQEGFPYLREDDGTGQNSGTRTRRVFLIFYSVISVMVTRELFLKVDGLLEPKYNNSASYLTLIYADLFFLTMFVSLMPSFDIKSTHDYVETFH